MIAPVPARKTILKVTSTMTRGAIDIAVVTSREPKLSGGRALRRLDADR
jgi:hypothetical protein